MVVIIQLLTLFTLYFTALFEFEASLPTLILLKAGNNASTEYVGPRDFESLVRFININTGRGPAPPDKVSFFYPPFYTLTRTHIHKNTNICIDIYIQRNYVI